RSCGTTPGQGSFRSSACYCIHVTLKQYLDGKPFVRARRGVGRESDWLEFCNLELPGGVLFVFDPAMLPGEAKGCRVKLVAGEFAVTAKVITYWKDSRISRLRVCLVGVSPVPGKRVGSVAPDLGLIGIADHTAYTSAWERDRDAFKTSVSN